MPPTKRPPPTAAEFDAQHQAAFSFPHPSLELGRAHFDGALRPVPVRLPLSMANRHGLIAGATGTGKTKTLQGLAEQFSKAGVPVFLADVKGDLAGLARPGEAKPHVLERATALGLTWSPEAAPIRLWSLTGKGGAQLRTTLTELGPVLLSRVLDLNDTQSSVLSMVFQACDDGGLLLIDLPDLKSVLQWLATPDAAPVLAKYGGLSKATTGVILRKVVELESQGGDAFFGEPELDLNDLLELDANGRGLVHVLDLTDVQQRPKLFSTAMLWILAELYERLPERGDADRPLLAFFFDEAHLLFDDAPKALLEQVDQVVRLIRSKGVGVYFVTQTPADVPEAVLAQLGNRIQHALRAFTPKDRKAIKLTAENFPETPFTDVAATLTTMEIGVALCSLLNPRGAHSPTVVATLPPQASRMGPLTPAERELLLMGAPNVEKYATRVDRESAHELLAEALEGPSHGPAPIPDMNVAVTPPASNWPPPAPSWNTSGGGTSGGGTSGGGRSDWGAPPPPAPRPRLPSTPRAPARTTTRRPAAPKDPVSAFMGSTAGREVQRQLVRGLFGLLKGR